MKVKDIIKKQTTIIAIAVILVTVTVIGVSYSIFFDVKKNSQNQVITAGDLKMAITANAIDISEVKSTEQGLASAGIDYTPSNTGDLNANYSLYLYANENNTVDLSFIKYSLDGTNSEVLTSITDKLTENGKTYYKVDSGVVNAKATGTKKNIKIWVDDNLANDTVEGKKVGLSFYIVSEVKE